MRRRAFATVLGAVSGVVLAVMPAAVLGTAAPAAAHVTVDPQEAVQGGYARVVFRVPNERNTATTTEVSVTFPEKHPVGTVRTMRVPGWQATVEERTVDPPIERRGQRFDSVVSRLTWTADGKSDAVRPGEFVEFPVSLGLLPETRTLAFTTVQTYDNGEAVRWDDDPTKGAAEHPAPALTLAGSPEEVAAPPVAQPPPHVPRSAEPGDSGAPFWLAVLGLIAGLAGLALGGLAALRTGVFDRLIGGNEVGDGQRRPEN